MSIFLTALLVSISLSMDTFSLSLAYGMIVDDKITIMKISLIVGVYHFIMPLIGNIIGIEIYNYINFDKNILIGIIFLLIAIELILSIVNEENIRQLNSIFQINLFALAVSIDSFSLGLVLDVIGNNKLLIVSLFFITSFLFTLLGLLLGKKLKDKIDNKADIIGLILILILAIYYLFISS